MEKNINFIARGFKGEEILDKIRWYIDRLIIENNIKNNDDITIYISNDIWYRDIKPIVDRSPYYMGGGKLFGCNVRIKRVSDAFITINYKEYAKSLLNKRYGYGGPKEMRTYRTEIKRVIFNDPVTVILWEDGTKTMVRCQGREKYDPEKGFALCVAKRFLGDNENRSNYYDVYKKWAPEDNNKKRRK